jgi:hypothetical protein
VPGTPVATDALRDEIGKVLWRRKQLRLRRGGGANGRSKERSFVQAVDVHQCSIGLMIDNRIDQG